MGKNSDLLKDAIADAKAVRETALANARMRMEEAFTPRLQSMISAKLQNEVEGEDEEEDMIDEPEVAPEIDAEMPVEEPVDAPIEEPVAVDAEPGSEVDIEVEPEVAPEDEVEEEGYELDLESIIKELDLEADAEDVDMEEPSFEDDNVFESKDEDDEDEEKEELEETKFDLTSAPSNKSTADVTSKITSKGPTPGKQPESPDRGKPFSTIKGADSTPDALLKQNPKNAIYEEEDEEFQGDDEEINLDEILRELEEADLSASIPDPLEDSTSNPFKSMNEQLSTKVSRLSKDLKEHRQVIKFLKSKLNEVNLLNAKLLFTSKLFKSNNLTNSQKMKVIESFDRAKSLREVKLVYSTIAESFGNTKSEPTVKKSVKSITEQINGGASKVVASTKPSAKIISEAIVSEEGAARLRKLAFGNKKKK